MRLLRFLFLILALFNFQQTLAWGFRGHILISQIAFDNLSPKAQTKANHYADFIMSDLSQGKREWLLSKYRNANNFARVSTLPDTWRNITLVDIFNRFNASLPPILKSYQYNFTNHWHFLDQGYPHSKCNLIKKYNNLVWAINILTKAWHETKDQNTKAVIMVFLAHFIGDSEQPLHTFSRVNPQCKSDFGGNKFYLKIGNRRSNLHALWDSGVGFLSHRINFRKKAGRLQEEFPQKYFGEKIKIQNPASWVEHNLKYAKFIYSLKRNQHVPASYYYHGQWIARKQITLAGYRLAHYLNRLLSITYRE